MQFFTQATNRSKNPPVRHVAAMLNFHVAFLSIIKSCVSLAVKGELLSEIITDGHPLLEINLRKLLRNAAELVLRTTSKTTPSGGTRV